MTRKIPKKEQGFDPEDFKVRRARGLLAWDVDMICRKFVTDGIEMPEGQFLTPYFIAKLIKEEDHLEDPPSVGAVSNILNKWEKTGYVICRQEPFAFTRYTELGQELGLVEFYEKFPVIHKNTKSTT